MKLPCFYMHWLQVEHRTDRQTDRGLCPLRMSCLCLLLCWLHVWLHFILPDLGVLHPCPHVCLCGSVSHRRLPPPAFKAVLFCFKISTCLPFSLNLILASSGFSKSSKMQFFLLLALHYMNSKCVSLNISNTDFSLLFGSDSELKCSFKSVYLPFLSFLCRLFVFAAQRGSFFVH